VNLLVVIRLITNRLEITGSAYQATMLGEQEYEPPSAEVLCAIGGVGNIDGKPDGAGEKTRKDFFPHADSHPHSQDSPSYHLRDGPGHLDLCGGWGMHDKERDLRNQQEDKTENPRLTRVMFFLLPVSSSSSVKSRNLARFRQCLGHPSVKRG